MNVWRRISGLAGAQGKLSEGHPCVLVVLAQGTVVPLLLLDFYIKVNLKRMFLSALSKMKA